MFRQKRNYIRDRQSIKKANPKLTDKTRYKIQLSHSLNLNNTILSNTQETDHLVDLLDISKSKIVLSKDKGLI